MCGGGGGPNVTMHDKKQVKSFVTSNRNAFTNSLVPDNVDGRDGAERVIYGYDAVEMWSQELPNETTQPNQSKLFMQQIDRLREMDLMNSETMN
ncbi:hypothetical protein EVAR_80960_1 [Eumeta japonica]|uniref:Uncharacterized protein n=1 Tax=Eumeta variegata TaxID=151549 RepID=A0A4C1WQ65_EUMVA|nr:hypothetical protein EVAR_80960_1 [Eumeta japonica]